MVSRFLITIWGLFLFSPSQAQLTPANVIKGGLFVGGAILLSKKVQKNKQANNGQPNNGTAKNNAATDTSAVFVFNSRSLSEQTPANIQDISGIWEGEVTDGKTVWYYAMCFSKIGDNSYSGIDSLRLERKVDNTPVQTETFHLKQTFTGNLNTNEALNFSNIENVGISTWPPIEEHIKFVMDKGNVVIVNNNDKAPARKLYLKRTSLTLPDDLQKYVVTKSSLEIADLSYKNSKNNAVLGYNDNGQLIITLKNSTAKDLSNVQIKATISEPANGIINRDRFNATLNLAKNSQNSFPGPVYTNFSVPRDPVHITITLSYKEIELAQKTITLSTDPFFKTNTVSVPAYTSPRLEAVAGYYGWSNTPYSDVSKQLEPLVASGDKLAAMWKAVFLSMGHGEYKIDEDQGYAIGRSCIKTVEDKARQGDAEAIYLMFYACELGLEGDNARSLSGNFLERAADAGFKPAVYDYALQLNWQKDYASALKYLVKSYDLGVKKAAEIIGYMYEKGLSVGNDNDSAIYWYKAGMAYGDPDAILCYANLVANGFNNTPPDINKAIGLATSAATKNCTDAMIFNGTLYFDGKQGVSRNTASALKWYKSGADLGDRQAMLALGLTYIAGGEGVTKDERSGLFWIKKAAEAGSPKAMLILAHFYIEGTIAEKNIIAARYWYNQAVLKGYARPDGTGMNANRENFMNFWKYADFSPSCIYVNEYGEKVGDAGDGMLNGICSGLIGSMFSYYGNQQQLIDGLEFIHKKSGYKIYGGTVSSHFISTLYLKPGQTVSIRSYGIVSTGYFSGAATADGLGAAWPEYRIVQGIPCSAVMAGVKDSEWKFIGQNGVYTSTKDGPLVFALNAIDYRSYKGYFDIVVQIPEN